MPLSLRLLISLIVLTAAVIACASDPAPTRKFHSRINCSAPPPVHDIWALEPLLIKSGRIQEDMNQVQREHEIRAYIAQTNQEFMNKCKEQR